ncbi:MAG: TonB-dependent receptor [Gammaproteobacteria bacterium]|nr:MAG: TonB-dependent receptor [Gammaproteobacteria bacterium]
MTKRVTWLAMLSAGVGGIAAAGGAAAQEPGAVAQVDEIVVTARRREETLLDVPVAVTSISGDALIDAGAQDLTAITQTTPNVTLENSRATNSTLTAFIRGVGQQDPVAGFEQGVGIYLDDVYLNRPQGAVLDVYDLERVEVLRGPQGTLYGRNTIGGAIKYVTRRPDPHEAMMRVRVAYGSYNQFDAIASGSAPLTETFRIGAAFGSFQRDGFGDNLTTGEENYEKDVLAARISAEWEPTEDFLVRLAVDRVEDDSAPRHGYRLLPSVSPGQQYLLDDDFDTTAGIATSAPSSDNSLEGTGGQLLIDWSPAENWLVRSISAWREDETHSLIDFDSTPSQTFDGIVVYENEQLSQELQLNYEGERLSFVGGAYYLDANAFNAFDVVFGAATSFTLGDVDTKTWALFGEATWQLGEEFSVSLGGRYTEDERSSHVRRQTYLGKYSPYFGNSAALNITPTVTVDGQEVVPNFHGSRTDDAFTPRVIVAWKPGAELNLYASYAKGFKGGSFDPRGNFANADIRGGFLPEFVESWELGAKAVLLDGRARMNTALFFADYTDVQIPGSVVVLGPPVSFVGTVTNAGAAEINGVEFEGSLRFTEHFSGALSFGYMDAKYTEFVVAGTDIAGQRDVQNTPDWTGSGNLSWAVPLALGSADGTLTLGVTAAYRSATQQFEQAIPLIDQPAYWLYDASMTWKSDDERWRLGLYGRNLGDERYITSGYNFPVAATDNSVLAFYGNPRTVTAAVEFRF